VRYRDPALRNALASEYVLGTLQGRVRRRFERVLKEDPALRRLVSEWQDRLQPLNDAVQPVRPPERVWRKIERRIVGRRQRHLAALWDSIRFWRAAAVTGALAALALAVTLVLLPAPSRLMVVVMEDQSQQPKISVSWDRRDAGRKRLRVRVIGHQTMAPETAWELWMLREGGPPLSLGLITTHELQDVVVPPELAAALDTAVGLAMSVEPEGGSPTGVPSGPVLYQGLCTEI
jgi:anti-sigma-K factor RskA